jgi:hypothetical protein
MHSTIPTPTSAPPQIIWVVGDNTNVGKTTISAALIRSFNAIKKTAIGFKPYAGARLIDIVDLLEEIAAGDQLLVGRDARKLAKASALTPTPYLELINPSWRISHPTRDACVLMRKGSELLGQRHFLQTRSTLEFVQSGHFSQLNQLIKLPTTGVRVIADLPADTLDGLAPHIQAQSFSKLMELNPEMVVCEGAGRLLPYWPNAPIPRHLFLISNGHLYMFPDIALNVTPNKDNALHAVPTIAAIMQDLQGKRHMKQAIPVLGSAHFEHKMDRFVSTFVQSVSWS